MRPVTIRTKGGRGFSQIDRGLTMIIFQIGDLLSRMTGTAPFGLLSAYFYSAAMGLLIMGGVAIAAGWGLDGVFGKDLSPMATL